MTKIITPPGFSKDFQNRYEKALIKKAMNQANQIPQLPPELAAQIANGVALAMQGKFSNIQVGLGSALNTQHVRILIFKDDMGSASAKPIENGAAPVVPQDAPEREYEVGTTEDAAKAEAGKSEPTDAA